MVINNAIIYGLTIYMNPVFGLGWVIWVNFAKIMGVGVAVIWNYLGYKILVFNLRNA
jgi:putative flippase GtrA